MGTKSFNKEELQLLHDGLEDTLFRLKHGQISEDFETYTSKIIILRNKVETIMNNRFKYEKKKNYQFSKNNEGKE